MRTTPRKKAAEILDEYLRARLDAAFAEGDLENHQRWKFVRTLAKVAIKEAARD